MGKWESPYILGTQNKVSGYNLTSRLKQTPKFEWCVVRFRYNMDTKKTCVLKRLNYLLNIYYTLESFVK